METKNPIPSALIVPLEVADPIVDPWRARFDPAHAQGVHAHVTLLYPFLPRDELDEDVTAELRAIFRQLPRATVRLTELRVRDSLIYLHPEADGWFDEAVAAVRARWPAVEPYEGRYGPNPPPHLTLAYHRPPGPDPLRHLDEIRAAVEPLLPVEEEVDHVLLSVLREGRWVCRARMGLQE